MVSDLRYGLVVKPSICALSIVRRPDNTARCVALACALLSAVVACSPQRGGPGPAAITTVGRALRVEIAQAEAQREHGVARLLVLAKQLSGQARWLAIRGLGRVGGARALQGLRELLQSTDALTVAQAASGLGIVGALEQIPAEQANVLSDELIRASLRVGPHLGPVLEALGRAGTATAQSALATALQSRDPLTAELAALALGRHGRRKLSINSVALDGLIASARRPERSVRYAAVYALSRQVVAPSSVGGAVPQAVMLSARALTASLDDVDPEIRAAAVAGLGRRLLAVPASAPLLAALADRDWRVAIEANNALAASDSSAVADAARARLARCFSAGDLLEAHVVAAALGSLAAVISPLATPASSADAKRAVVQLADAVLAQPASSKLSSAVVARLQCLAQTVLQQSGRAADYPALMTCGGNAIAQGDRATMVVEVVKAGVGPLADRQRWLASMLASADPIVQAAALAGVDGSVAPWSVVVDALASSNVVVVGAASDAVDRGLEAKVADANVLTAALLRRAAVEHDPELAAGLLSVIGKYTLAGGAQICANVVAHPVVMAARAECLAKFAATSKTNADSASSIGSAATLPPPKVAAAATPATVPAPIVFAPGLAPWPALVRWRLQTSRGAIEIEINGELAPWHAAVIRNLTQRGFYNGLRFHRFVGNFVVQGGDPTGTGWGGPGFVVPSEVGSLLDGVNQQFSVGAVGFADAGKDTGGSQWFVMHARAPHLEGRYTVLGQVTAGLAAAMQLNVGDTVQTAVILQ